MKDTTTDALSFLEANGFKGAAAELREALGKAIRFNLYQANIDQIEHDSIELDELRAQLARLRIQYKRLLDRDRRRRPAK